MGSKCLGRNAKESLERKRIVRYSFKWEDHIDKQSHVTTMHPRLDEPLALVKYFARVEVHFWAEGDSSCLLSFIPDLVRHK